MLAHSPKAPSFAEVWTVCAFAPTAAAQIPEVETDEQREGTATHWVAETSLNSYRAGGESIVLCSDLVGRSAPNGVTVTPDMARGAAVYVSAMLKIVQKGAGWSNTAIEHRCDARHLHPDMYGTADFIHADGATLYVADYKNGHLPVPAARSLQLTIYALGVLPLFPAVEKVVFIIVQPNTWKPCGPVDVWETTRADIEGLAPWLVGRAELADECATATSGPHCAKCPAVGRCEAAHASAHAAVSIASNPVLLQNTPEHAGSLLSMYGDALKVLEAVRDALATQAEADIMAGRPVPGWTMQPGRPVRRHWVGENTVDILESMTETDLHERKPCSPAEAERRGVSKAVIQGFTKSGEGKPTLTRVNLAQIEGLLK